MYIKHRNLNNDIVIREVPKKCDYSIEETDKEGFYQIRVETEGGVRSLLSPNIDKYAAEKLIEIIWLSLTRKENVCDIS